MTSQVVKVTVYIDDVNDNRPRFMEPIVTLSIIESASPGSTSGSPGSTYVVRAEPFMRLSVIESATPGSTLGSPGSTYAVPEVPYFGLTRKYFGLSRHYLRHSGSSSASPGSTYVIPAATDADSPQFAVQRYELDAQTNKFGLEVTQNIDGSQEVLTLLHIRYLCQRMICSQYFDE